MGKNLKVLTNGLLNENPTFVQMLGMCPTLAVTVSAKNGLGMGLATTAVLIMANAVISALRKVIPGKIRIPAFIVVIASAVTIVGMLMETYLSSLYEVLGLFIPLIVVNCIILARAEAFAFENGVIPSLFDGIGMGLGFTISLTLIGIVREFFGEFKFFGNLIFEGAEPMLIFIQPPGAFLTLAILLAIYNQVNISKAKKAKAIVDAQREEEIQAQLEATRISEEKFKKRQEEKAAKEKAKKEAEKKAKAEAEAKAKAEAEAAAANGDTELTVEPKEEAKADEAAENKGNDESPAEKAAEVDNKDKDQ